MYTNWYLECLLREAIKKPCEILDIVWNSDDPPPGWYGGKKFGRLGWAQTPLPKFGHFDVKSLNGQNHVLRKFGSIKKYLKIISWWVGRWLYSFSVLSHAYHNETEILFRGLKNKLLDKKNSLDKGLQPPHPLYTCPYFSSMKSLAAGQCPNLVVFFFDGFPKWVSKWVSE